MSSRKRSSAAAGLNGMAIPSSSPAPTPKRRRPASASSSAKRQRAGHGPPDEDTLLWSDSDNDSDIIDLRDPTKVPEILLQRQQKKADRVKLGGFQCAICMDHATSLTVTHCGHLFCGDCLVSALNIENQKNKCPICRQKIENKPRDSYKQNTKGLWPLELKLMTTSRKGKRLGG
ncbi:hypothetical protein jhhlp_000063 [Lomentospora prolificans]|uniref:RING-type domain-containing protein n=1 Tax=Lomentospora prolificans TaxID=41688 RepID=A0A2N3NLP2_9PEZI|nr:hypothetical protein jhhlp_000063 [Lomentospora prolificans]